MTTPITGGCLCGAVRYTLAAEPNLSGNCYCSSCRKESSAGHISVLAAPEDAFTVSGPLSAYEAIGGSGAPLTRYFCSTCGSTVYASPGRMPGAVMVRASTLDDPERFAMQLSIFTAEAPSWDRPPEDAPSFEGAPPTS